MCVAANFAKYLRWGAVFTASGVLTTTVDAYIRASIAKKNEERIKHLTIDCLKNNFGCIENICWTHCGPRLSAADWCITTRNDSVPIDQLHHASCKIDHDCDPCLPCARECILENVHSIFYVFFFRIQ